MAIVRYAGNRMTGVSGDTKPSEGSLITGTTFHETNTDDLYIWDGDSWNIVTGNTVAETLSSKTLTSPVLNTGLSGTAFLDEDNFASDAADKVASQQSIKAYVASQVPGSQNVFNTVAVSGQDNVVADSATDTLTIAAGSGMTITTTAGSDTVTFASSGTTTFAGLTDTTIGSLASGHVLIYDGSNSWDNKAVSGDITIASTGAVTIAATAVTNGMLAGSIADSKLSTISTGDKVSGSAVQLAGTSALEDSSGLRIKAATAGAGLAISSQVLSVGVDDSSIEINSDALRVKASGITNTMLAGSIANDKLAGSIANGKLANSSITVSDGSNTSAVALGGTVTFAATANETTVAESSGTVTIGLPDNVTIAGNLIVTGNSTVNGDTVTQNVATVSVEDPLMALASGNNAADAVDIGFYGLYDTSGSQDLYAGLFRDANDSGKWKLFKDLQAAPTTTVNVSGTGYAVGTLVANIEGNATGSSGSTTGNAATATALANARTIGGTSFDGTANIAVGLAATATALATARTIGGTSFDGTANIAVALAATSTALATARTIGGVSFDGTANINLPGVNATGNQNTSGTAANVTGTVVTSTGGTGLTSYTAGDVLYYSTGTTLTKLTKGTAGQVLTMNSGATAPEWAASSSSGASESFAIAMAVAL
jgi:hypothetical protein